MTHLWFWFLDFFHKFLNSFSFLRVKVGLNMLKMYGVQLSHLLVTCIYEMLKGA